MARMEIRNLEIQNFVRMLVLVFQDVACFEYPNEWILTHFNYVEIIGQ